MIPRTFAVLVNMTLFLGLAGTPAMSLADDDRDASRLINDCGVNSLYLLLRLRSADVDLTELRRSLPDTEAHGLSMAEIQAVSHRYGVPLKGRQIRAADVPIDRPTIVLLKSSEGRGHFVVLEPVGTLGKMVMVLDFPRPVRIVTYADLMNGPDWTGLALAPVTAWERVGPWIASGAGVSLVVLGLTAPWRRRQVVATAASRSECGP